jgi:hypothetical protein
MSPQQLEKIAAMRERGWSYKRIGNAIGMSPGAVSWYCLREAIEPPKPSKCRDQIVGPAVVKRGDHVVRRFTPEEDATLLRLSKEGKSNRALVRLMGRSDSSIRGRLMCLARREERGAAMEAAE